MTHPAVLYDSDGLDPSRPRLTGLRVATASFMRALLDHGAPGPFTIQPTGETTVEAVRARFPTDREIRIVRRIEAGRLAECGGLFLPGPLLGPDARRRRHVGDSAYCLTGITHAMSSVRAMDAVREFVAAPIAPWDALICASTSIRDLVETLLDREAEEIGSRFGIVPPTGRPMLPVIPLGVEPAAFSPDDAARAAFRQQHDIPDESVAILYLGRLAAHAKAHPIPMFRALGLAAQRAAAPLVAVLAGWFHDDVARAAFLETARELAPQLRLLVVDAEDAGVRKGALAAGDIFLSLVDNVQESFGLTPVEAMASGLPAVVSDWDGYRDTVVDGETGYLVPTAMPPPGMAADLAWRRLAGLDDEAIYHAQLVQMIAPDPARAADAIVRLAENASLRKRMGEAGRRRVREVLAWDRIIPRYEALWAEQRERREQAARDGVGQEGRSAAFAGDPTDVFRSFPSVDLSRGAVLKPSISGSVAELSRMAALPLAVIDPRLPDIGRALLAQIPESGTGRLGPDSDPLAWRAALWLAKLGIVRIDPL